MMHWYDHVVIFCALILALWADYDAGIALRASIVNYLSGVEEDEDGTTWVRAYELRQMFGPSAYKHLHRLVAEDVIERRETSGGPERGGRADFSYRWRDDE